MEDVLRIDKVLDYCDVPQVFVARDAFDTLYLCLLYADEPECCYTGIRISTQRLESFLSGGIDLRSLFVHSENKQEYFDVTFQEGKFKKVRLKEKVLAEEKLPAEGYILSGDMHENVVITLPVKDKGLLTELVHKFGWACM